MLILAVVASLRVRSLLCVRQIVMVNIVGSIALFNALVGGHRSIVHASWHNRMGQSTSSPSHTSIPDACGRLKSFQGNAEIGPDGFVAHAQCGCDRDAARVWAFRLVRSTAAEAQSRDCVEACCQCEACGKQWTETFEALLATGAKQPRCGAYVSVADPEVYLPEPFRAHRSWRGAVSAVAPGVPQERLQDAARLWEVIVV